MADYTGQVLGGYQLVKVLGQGSAGRVYLGESLTTKDQVAVKLFAHAPWPNLATHLADAFRPAAQLQHPSILRLREMHFETEHPYLVMDYVPYGSMQYRYPLGQPLPLPLVVAYATQVAEAVQYAHDLELLHGALRPGELLLGQNKAILVDFTQPFLQQAIVATGFSLAIGPGSEVLYMAPEQLLGKPLLKASDQFSLGIVVYQWLTGVRPFPDLAWTATLRTYAAPSLRLYNSTIPEVVEMVVQKAMAKDSPERYESMAAFATALEEASKGQA